MSSSLAKRIGVMLIAVAVSTTAIRAQPSRAQSPRLAEASVQAYGEKWIELKPQKIRLILVAKAEGPDAKDALAALTEHKQKVREELIALKADKESIQMAPAEIDSHLLGLPKQYWTMSPKAIQNYFDDSVELKLDEMPVVFLATSIVEADWTLPSTDADLLSRLPISIRQQASVRDLIGEENRMSLSLEQEARVEKFKAAIEENMGFYDSQEERDGQLQILFVSTMSATVRRAGLQAAFDQAKEECVALADASGHRLGRMLNLAKNAVDEADNLWMAAGATSGEADVLLSRQTRPARQGEFTALRPDLLMARLQVRASFELLQ